MRFLKTTVRERKSAVRAGRDAVRLLRIVDPGPVGAHSGFLPWPSGSLPRCSRTSPRVALSMAPPLGLAAGPGGFHRRVPHPARSLPSPLPFPTITPPNPSQRPASVRDDRLANTGWRTSIRTDPDPDGWFRQRVRGRTPWVSNSLRSIGDCGSFPCFGDIRQHGSG